jgi:hypothetical protein
VTLIFVVFFFFFFLNMKVLDLYVIVYVCVLGLHTNRN